MPAKSPKLRELKGLDGSNPPRSSSQSAICAYLCIAAATSRVHAGFSTRKGTGEALTSHRWGDFRRFLSAAWRAGSRHVSRTSVCDSGGARPSKAVAW